MKYVSTRRFISTDNEGVTFEEAILQGYAPDGGLFVPEKLPTITAEELQRWAHLSYTHLTFQVLRKFISSEEIPNNALEELCTDAFQTGWYHVDVIPVVQLMTVQDHEKESASQNFSEQSSNSLYVSELFHGPTHCFKDLGMIMMILLLKYFATEHQKKVILLVSTTGDTGPAAVHAVRRLITRESCGDGSGDKSRASTIKVTVVSFEGGGDDMDAPIKNILTELGGKSDTNCDHDDHQTFCTGVNSYNIARPVMQAVHFIWTYLRVIEKHGDIGDPDLKVNFVLPTGAMGNIAGGYMAKKMGLPIGMLCAAVNENDITHRAFQTGKFHKSSTMKKTLSDAINIQIPYNFERLLYYLANEDPDQVRLWMKTVDATDKLDLDTPWLQRLQNEFDSARVDDQEMCQTLLEIRDEYGYVADPHTAVALAAAKKLGYFGGVCFCAVLATASPCKFQESVTEALGEEGWRNYFNSKCFPSHAKLTLKLREQPVIEYKWTQGADLVAVQTEWELRLRSIIADLSSPKETIY